jgi:excisionase family DNA binding protein
MDSYLTVTETATYLQHLGQFVRRRIAFYHVGRHVRVALSDVQAWLAVTQRVEPHRAASRTRRAWRKAS